VGRRPFGHAPWTGEPATEPDASRMLHDLQSLTVTQMSVGAAAVLVLLAYAVFVVSPAWASYGRLWERIAASFLTVYILATLIVAGAGIGFAIVWSYDRWA
jgi:hypothetical protein